MNSVINTESAFESRAQYGVRSAKRRSKGLSLGCVDVHKGCAVYARQRRLSSAKWLGNAY